jgi:hypothetical protein
VFIPQVDPLLIGGMKPFLADTALKCGCYRNNLIMISGIVSWGKPTTSSLHGHARSAGLLDFRLDLFSYCMHSRDQNTALGSQYYTRTYWILPASLFSPSSLRQIFSRIGVVGSAGVTSGIGFLSSTISV